MTTTRPARVWAEVTGGDALGRGQQPALCWWLPEGSVGAARLPAAHRRRVRHGPGGGRDPVVRPAAGLRPFPALGPGAGQGVDRRGRERVERPRSARIRPARGAGLAGPVDRRAGGRTAGEGIAARLLAQDAHRRSPGGRGPAVPHRARPVRGVPGRDACRRRRTRAWVHPVPRAGAVSGLRRHVAGAAGAARARRPAGRRVVPRPGRAAPVGGPVRRRRGAARPARGADRDGLAGRGGQPAGLANCAFAHHRGRPDRRPARGPAAARRRRARPVLRRPNVARGCFPRRRRRHRPVGRSPGAPGAGDPAGRRAAGARPWKRH